MNKKSGTVLKMKPLDKDFPFPSKVLLLRGKFSELYVRTPVKETLPKEMAFFKGRCAYQGNG